MHSLIKKIKFFLECLYATLKFYILAKFRSKKFCNSVSEDSNYIISLTSYHKRFDTLYLTLESLLRQSHKPKAIYLWLSSDDIKKYKSTPFYLEDCKKRGVVINILNENLKSYKKLCYIENVLRDAKIDFVLTADDDIMYPSNWAKKLISVSELHKAVSCFRGHFLKYNGKTFDYNNSINDHSLSDEPSFRLLPTGCSGICYPRNSISNLVSDKRFIKYANDADDIWFKGMTLLQGFKSVRVNEVNKHFPLILSSMSDTLYSKNVNKSENEQKLILTFTELKLLDVFK
ncbi:hypothetical protein ABFP30_002152 [Enterobacter bugandensis]